MFYYFLLFDYLSIIWIWICLAFVVDVNVVHARVEHAVAGHVVSNYVDDHVVDGQIVSHAVDGHVADDHIVVSHIVDDHDADKIMDAKGELILSTQKIFRNRQPVTIKNLKNTPTESPKRQYP